MANITIKKLDDRVLDRLRAQAKKRKTSLNSHLKDILASTVGMKPGLTAHSDLTGIAGSWTEKEWNEFSRNTREFGQVDPKLWR